jgi:hypothetical protein
MTRLADHVARPLDSSEVEERLVARFTEVFGHAPVASG